MKNNKMTREEKRRLLFNKKYEIGASLHNDSEPAPVHTGAAEGVMSKTREMNRRIIAAIVAFAIVMSCIVVGFNIATKAEDNAEPTSSLKPVTMEVRLNGQDGYTTATVPAGVIETNKDDITFVGTLPQQATFQKALLIDHESNTETEIARVAKFEGKTYYSLDANDNAGTLLLATQDLVLVYAEKYAVNITKTGNGTYTTSATEEGGGLYVWGGEDLTIQTNPAQDYYTGQVEYSSAGQSTKRVSPKNNYVKISADSILGDLDIAIPFVHIDEYTINDARYMNASKYYPELKGLDNHGGITGVTNKQQTPTPVAPGETATFYLFSQANSTNSQRFLLNNLAINGVDIKYPKTVGQSETTPFKNGSSVTVTLLSENNKFDGETSWPNEKPRTIYKVEVTNVHEDIEVSYYFKDQYKKEIIIKGLNGIEQTAYAAEDTNIALVSRYYSFVQDEIYKNVYTAYYSSRGVFTDINWFPSDNLVLYTVKPGYNPYTVTTEMYYDDVPATGVIRDAEAADTPVNVIKSAGSGYEDAGRYNTSQRYWGYSEDTELYNHTTSNYLKRVGLNITRTDLLLTTLNKRSETWYAVALSQNESYNQQLFLNATPYEYHIECDLNGGSISAASEGYTREGNKLVSDIFTLENGEVYTALPSVAPTQSGKRFLGWQMVDENGNNIAGGFYTKNAQFVIGKDTVDKAVGDKTEDENQTFKFMAVWQDDATADTTTVSTAVYQEVLSRDEPDATYVTKDNGKLYKLVNYSEEEQHTAQTTILLNRHEPSPADAYVLNDSLSNLETITVAQTTSVIPAENQLAAYYDFNVVKLTVTKEVYGRPNTKAFNISVKLTPPEDYDVFTLQEAQSLIDDNDLTVNGDSLSFTDLFENGDDHIFNNVPYGWTFEVSEETKPTDYTSVIRNGNKTSEDNQPLLGTLTADTDIVVENSKLNDDKNVETDKWLTKNDDGTYKLTMEAYATGQTVVDEVQNAVPTDYVLVLDQSGSMATSDMPNGYDSHHGGWTCESAKGKYYKDSDGKYYPVVYKNKPEDYNYYSISSPHIRELTTYDSWISLEVFGDKDEETKYENDKGIYGTFNQEVYYKASDNAYYRVHTYSQGLTVRYHGTLYYYDAYDVRHDLGTYTYTSAVWNPQVSVPLYTNSKLVEEKGGWPVQVTTGYHLETDKNPAYSLYYTDDQGVEHKVPGASTKTTTTEPIYDGFLYTPKENISRRKALENAVRSFTDIIEYQAEEYDVDHKIAVVGFSSYSGADNTEILSRKTALDTKPASAYNYLYKEFPDGVNYNGDQYSTISTTSPYENALLSPVDAVEKQHLEDAIKGITACGGTEPEYGFYMAKNIFDNRLEKQFTTNAGSQADRNTVVVFFTDGVPGNTAIDDQIEKANSVVSAALPLKNSGTSIYSIGIFDEGDGQPLTYTGNDPGNNAPVNYVSHGTIEGDSTEYYFYRGNDVSSSSYTDTISDYMRAVSSEYPTATKFYNKGTTDAASGAAPRGNRNSDGVNYYTKVTDSHGLTAAFDYISEQAGPTISTATLDASNSILRDIITDDFEVTDDYTITVYTANANYNEENSFTGWSEKEIAPPAISADFEDPNNPKVLNVTGFDYSNHYVAASNKTNAQKVIVELNGIKPNKTGGIFDSNTGDSGIYLSKEDNSEKFIDAFPIPQISRYKYTVKVEEDNTAARVGVDFTMTADDWEDAIDIGKDNNNGTLTFTPDEGSDTEEWKPNSSSTGAQNEDYIIFEEILESENNSGVVHNDNIPDEYALATVVKNPDTSGDYEYTIYIDGVEVPLDENNVTALTDLPQRDADIVVRSRLVTQQILIRKLTRTEGSEDDFADHNRKFDIKVQLLDKNGNTTTTATYDDVEFDSTGTATIPLAHNQMKIFNIPNNYKLVVSEDNASPYVTSYVLNGAGEEITDETLSTDNITSDTSVLVYNTIEAPVITGFSDGHTDVGNIFFAIAGIVALGAGAWFIVQYKRKKETELAAYQAGKSE